MGSTPINEASAAAVIRSDSADVAVASSGNGEEMKW
jgi:hypothetical protein